MVFVPFGESHDLSEETRDMLLDIYQNQQKFRWFVMNNKITSLPLPNHHMFE